MVLSVLKQHPVILVTGPHRSGTTFASKVVASETGYRLIDESRWATHHNHNVWTFRRMVDYLMTQPRSVVMHHPGATPWVHLLEPWAVAVVMVRRPVDEIVLSEDRINWRPHEREVLDCYFRTEHPSAYTVYEVWDKWQKRVLSAAYDLEYHSLETHPLWVSKEKRKQFTPHQTEEKV